MTSEIQCSVHARDPELARALTDIARGDLERNVRARVGPICASIGEQACARGEGGEEIQSRKIGTW